MPELPNLEAALERVMSLTYPPTTLRIASSKAIGHRLARAVVARGNQPSRPFATKDGLAVIARDVVRQAGREASGLPGTEEEDDCGGLDDLRDEISAEGNAPESPEPDYHSGHDDDPAEEQSGEEPEGSAGGDPEYVDDGSQSVSLELRPFPATNRKEDALAPGFAIPVHVGGEVPRGGEVVYPFESFIDLDQAIEELAPEPAGRPVSTGGDRPEREENGNGNDEDSEDDRLPVEEPDRVWDLEKRHGSGRVELNRLDFAPVDTMVSIGGWARNREVILPEKTILRPPEMALLAALDIDEVEIYRRPVVGVASLSEPIPLAGRTFERARQEGTCVLQKLVTGLVRAARVAALPLGFAPLRFRSLIGAVNSWINQVDILVLVGGSHLGPSCLGLDVVNSIGEARLTGIDLNPGQATSAGKVNGKPVVVIPGSLPNVLVSTVLLVRPLAHKYLTPHHYSPTIELALDRGSSLTVSRDSAVPVRFGYDRERGQYVSRFSGHRRDAWMDYLRGQALVVLEKDKQYADGQVVTGYTY